jgi:hypothetical protein
MQDDALVASQMQRHVQRAQHEFGLQMIRHRPADESAGYGMLCLPISTPPSVQKDMCPFLRVKLKNSCSRRRADGPAVCRALVAVQVNLPGRSRD